MTVCIIIFPKRCIASTGLEMEQAIENSSCTSLKNTGFELGTDRLE